jgi:hypothetical protein
VHTAAAECGELVLFYAGTGTIDGRPTYVLERRLPYDPASDRYPNARLVLHVDQAWLLPVGVYSYADVDDPASLLGSYTMTRVQPNVGLTDAAFLLE